MSALFFVALVFDSIVHCLNGLNVSTNKSCTLAHSLGFNSTLKHDPLHDKTQNVSDNGDFA